MHRILQFAILTGVLAVGLRAAPLCTGTGVWNEGDGGQVDAGNLPKNANLTVGTGSLNEICGNIAGANGVDMYAIEVEGSTLYALADGITGNPLTDPNLYLFNSTGAAVAEALDVSGEAELNLSDLTAGIYYVAITTGGVDPEDKAGNPVFTLPPPSDTVVSKWDTDDGDGLSGKYSITFSSTDPVITSDVGFSELPEPGTLALIGAGLSLFGMVKRRS